MERKTYPIYFAFGAIGLYVLLFVIPGIIGIIYSFTDWSAYSHSIHFVGFDNFKNVFSKDQNYLAYISNTIQFTFFTTIVKTVLGLFLALLLSEGIKGMNFHRALIFLPAILSILITGLMFRSILSPDAGILNQFLRTIGLGFLQQQWLTNIKIALYSIMAVDIWKGLGYIMTIILAGVQSVPRSYYEAANIDGANYWGKLKYITLPLIMPAITITTVLNLLHGLKVFDIVYMLTNGGPGHVTEVLYTAVYKSFSSGQYAIGTAASSVLFILMILIGFFVIKIMSKEEVELG